ncbi:MAG: 4-hydroxy-tetrahydrodipicolinate synthase [Balneolaceae bacterium]
MSNTEPMFDVKSDEHVPLWTALVTPMLQNGKIDLENLENLIRRQESSGNGVLLIGSTGEGLALSDREKRQVVEIAAGLNPTVPLMAGVGGYNLEAQKEWVRFGNQLEIDAFLMVAPLYSKPGPVGQKLWFEALLDVAEKPCMIYNIPSRTGVRIPPDVFAGLDGHPRFCSIKEASGSVQEYQAIREAVPDVPLYSGDDGLLPFFAASGCSGLVSVASNVWPEATRLYVDRCLKRDAGDIVPLWRRASTALFSAPNPIPAKHLLFEKGWISSDTLRPPLTSEDLSRDDSLKSVDREIENWLTSVREDLRH